MDRKVIPPAYNTALAFVFIGICAIVGAQLARYYTVSSSDIFQEGSWYATFHDFRLVHLQVNYFEHGYLRRGLVGTVFHALGIENVRFAGWLLSLGSILTFLAILGYVIAKLEPGRKRLIYLLLLIAVFGPAGVSQFIISAGQIDHVLLPLLTLAALAGVKGRLLLSLGLFFIMYLVHELSFIAFFPLLVICNIIGARDRSTLHVAGRTLPFCWRSVSSFGLVSVFLLMLTVNYGDSPEAVRAFSSTPDTRAIYGEMIWGEKSPMHPVSWNGMHSALLVMYYLVLIAFSVAYWKTISGPLALVPAAAASCLLLNLVGIDAGRWAAITTWTVMAAIVATEAASTDRAVKPTASGAVMYFGLLLALPVGPLGSTIPFTFTVKLLEIAYN
jgi:hypothetical protein